MLKTRHHLLVASLFPCVNRYSVMSHSSSILQAFALYAGLSCTFSWEGILPTEGAARLSQTPNPIYSC